MEIHHVQVSDHPVLLPHHRPIDEGDGFSQRLYLNQINEGEENYDELDFDKTNTRLGHEKKNYRGRGRSYGNKSVRRGGFRGRQ